MDIAGTHPHDRIMGAKEDDGVISGLLNSPGYLSGDAGGENIRVPVTVRRGRGTQVDGGGKLRVSSVDTCAKHAIPRCRSRRVEVRPNLTEKLWHARNVQSGGFYKKLERHLNQRHETKG